ncbi:MAG: phosphoribosyltransferase family protein [bacterium]
MLQYIFELLFPSFCINCNTKGKMLCISCAKSIFRALPHELSWVRPLYNYQNPIVKKIIKDAKYHHKTQGYIELIQYIRPEVLNFIQKRDFKNYIAIPAPQHISKTNMRGFNQAEKLAHTLFDTSFITIDTNIITKIKPTTPQAQIHTRSVRLKNTQYSMQANKICDTDTLYILVDDVITTGGTMKEMHRALSARGAKHIIGITLAH